MTSQKQNDCTPHQSGVLSSLSIVGELLNHIPIITYEEDDAAASTGVDIGGA